MSDRTSLFGRLGIWSRELRYGERDAALAAAEELEGLGYDTLWIPDIGGPVLEIAEELLSVTSTVHVATGILNVWMHHPADVAALHLRIDAAYPGRFVLGLGIGHAPVVDRDTPGRYSRPLSFMTAFLDSLDAAMPAGAEPPRVLAALAPKMMQLAAARARGTHPYLVPSEHTRLSRQTLGEDAVIAQELTVILEEDPAAARALARRDLGLYLGLPNYTNTWLRLGYEERDLADGGSDRLIDALYAWGGVEAIGERIEEYRAAGADHVCMRVAYEGEERLPLEEWRALAALTG